MHLAGPGPSELYFAWFWPHRWTPDVQFLAQAQQQQNDAEGLHFMTPSAFCPTSEATNVVSMAAGVNNERLFYSSYSTDHQLNSNLHNLSQDSNFGGNCSSSAFNNSSYFFSDISNKHILVTNAVSMSMVEEKIGLHDAPAFPDIAMEETSPINQCTAALVPAHDLQLKRKLIDHGPAEPDVNSSENIGKKKPRVTRNVLKTTEKNPVNSKKQQNERVRPKGNEGEESNINGGSDGQSSTSTYSSEDDNASQETNNEDSKASSAALNLSGKQRASRGSATDPQSLYARKRRERINERLKILQNLVPNGTKVDISTMLEEAVHYVKFLQVQIKLLSSDELWMYAPLAYNGIDYLCLNQKISSLL
ncbi:hypothetical protein AB3S75_012049 [Citrus x aurantiifolia]